MAVNTVIEGNILKIDDGVKIEYFNAGWVSISFDADHVYLFNNATTSLKELQSFKNPYKILKTEFQYNAVSITSESKIIIQEENKCRPRVYHQHFKRWGGRIYHTYKVSNLYLFIRCRSCWGCYFHR